MRRATQRTASQLLPAERPDQAGAARILARVRQQLEKRGYTTREVVKPIR